MICSFSFRGLLVALLVSCVQMAEANTPQNITPGEISRLPEYCPHSITFSPRGTPDAPTDQQRHWVALMGNTFWAIHHYCWALVNVNRAERGGLSPADRRYLFQWAIQDCYYVVNLATPDFPLMPEILTRIGNYYVEMDRVIEAMEHFERAKAIKSDYWPPYVGLANINLRLGRKNVAIDILNSAIQILPNEPNLLAALKRINSVPSPKSSKRTGASAP